VGHQSFVNLNALASLACQGENPPPRRASGASYFARLPELRCAADREDAAFELLQLRRTVAPTIEVCRWLEQLELPFIDDAIRAYFRDVVDHVQRVNESIDALRVVLAFSFEAALLLQAERQGDIQRRFAGWAAILAVPTAIAGIYGMNFDFMPELSVRFGYFGVLMVILAICLYLFYRFRKAGWAAQ
jgi:magnesium transporter